MPGRETQEDAAVGATASLPGWEENMAIALDRCIHIAIVALTAIMLMGLVSAISGCGRGDKKRETVWSGILTDYETTSSWTENPERNKRKWRDKQ